MCCLCALCSPPGGSSASGIGTAAAAAAWQHTFCSLLRTGCNLAAAAPCAISPALLLLLPLQYCLAGVRGLDWKAAAKRRVRCRHCLLPAGIWQAVCMLPDQMLLAAGLIYTKQKRGTICAAAVLARCKKVLYNNLKNQMQAL